MKEQFERDSETEEATITTTANRTFKDKIKSSYKAHPKRFVVITFILVVGILLAIILPVVISSNKLGKKEQACYEIMLTESYQFKNPKSVRIISGTVSYFENNDTTYCFLRLSAENGFGATVTDNYFCGKGNDGMFIYSLDDYKTSMPSWYSSKLTLCYETDDFDISAVNKALDKYWNNY